MILIDANLLIYAVDDRAPAHDRALSWLSAQLSGDQPIGIPWESFAAFLRVATNPRLASTPLSGPDAWRFVIEWLAAEPVWIPMPTDRHAEVLGGLVERYGLTGNLIPDARLAAIAIEHGLEVCSADTDFARFTEVRWRNPLAG